MAEGQLRTVDPETGGACCATVAGETVEAGSADAAEVPQSHRAVAIRQRLLALPEPAVADEDPAADGEADDPRRCGALMMRLSGAATPTAIAAWMGWTLERTTRRWRSWTAASTAAGCG